MSDLQSFLFLLVRKTPLIIVLLGGLLFAIVRWKHHPRVSLLASIGLVLYLIEILFISAVSYLLPAILERAGIAQGSNIYTVIKVIDDIIYSGILILFLTAALGQRRSQPALRM